MRRIIDNDILTLIIRLLVGSIFIYASYYKIIEPVSFAKSIWYYHLVPGSLINLVALILPWLELICGLALIFGIQYRGAVLWMNVMTIIFMIALTTAVVRGISIDCGCFKAAQATESSAMDALIRDVGLLILTLQLLFSRSKKWMIQKIAT
ncbi:MAG: DoxX family membrane protein [Calditrichaeota bacterium]|nr:MAG: DoxX family membrane protein [Calditrichota bacterium]